MNTKKTTKKLPSWLVRLIIAGALLIFTGVVWLLASKVPSLFFPWYREFSKGLMTVLSTVMGVVPVALWDFGEVALILLLIVSIVVMIMKKKRFLNWFSKVFLIVAALGSFVILGWMLNHYGPSLREEIGLSVREYTKEELEDAFYYYAEQATNYADRIERDENQDAVRQDFFELAERGGKIYENISREYACFRGSTARVKGLALFDQYLLYRGNSGEFMPITGESSLPFSDNVIDIPFTMAHEAAHRLGIASEEEANFAAFLACEASGDPEFLYSAYYSAFVYCYNALFKADYGALVSCLMELQEENPSGYALLIHDTNIGAVYYAKYEGPVQEAGTKVNDTYLKDFGHESGVESYGEVVDDLVAWYLKNYK